MIVIVFFIDLITIFGIWIVIDSIFSILTHKKENFYYQAGRGIRLGIGIALILFLIPNSILNLIGAFLIVDSVISITTHREENKVQQFVRILRLIIGILLIL